LDEAAMLRHIEERHMPKPERTRITVLVYDRFGNLVREEVK